MSELKHTPKPWWKEQSGFGGSFLRAPVTPDGEDKIIGSISLTEDAEFIVRAVNEYDELNEIRRLLLKAKERFDQGLPVEYSELIKKAIAQAEKI